MVRARARSRSEPGLSTLTYAIVTPARNERDNLKRLADSIIAQDHRPVTWIIVDDGSDDGMDAVARELALSHDWISVTGTGEPHTIWRRVVAAVAICWRSAKDLVHSRLRSTCS